MSLQNFREKYPQYNDMDDTALADSLHKKHYSDMSREEFDIRMGTSPSVKFGSEPGVGDLIQNAVTLGWNDEIVGGLRGGVHALADAGSDMLHGRWPDSDSIGKTFNKKYNETANTLRARTKIAREKYGYAPEVVAGFATGGPAIAAKAVGKIGSVGWNMVKTGAGWGGVAAAGEAEGGLQNRFVAGAKGAAFGAAAGKGLHLAGKGAGKLAPYVGKAAKRVGVGRTVDDHLLRALGRSKLPPGPALERFDLGQKSAHFSNPSGVNPQRAELPEMIADLGDGTRRLARAVATHSGTASQIARDALQKRSHGQYERVTDDLGRSLQVKSKDFHDEVQGVLARRKADSKQAYSAAYDGQQGFDINHVLDEYASEAAMHPAGSLARAKIEKALKMFRDVVENGGDLRRFDLAKQNLDDLIGKAKRQGAGNLTRTMTRMKHGLVDQVDAGNPLYRDARAIYSDASGMADAADAGRSFMRGDSDLTERMFTRMDKPEQDMYRLGVVQEMKKRLGTRQRGRDMTSDFSRPNIEQLFEVTAKQRGGSGPKWTGGSRRWRKAHFDELIKRERGFNATKNMVLGGSPTADKLADQADFAANTISDMIQQKGGITQAALDYLATKTAHMFDVHAGEAEAIARVIFETDPQIIRRTLRLLGQKTRPTKMRQLRSYVGHMRKQLGYAGGLVPGTSSAFGRDQGWKQNKQQQEGKRKWMR